MFAMVFRTQWVWTRMTLAGLSLLAFVFPALAWRLAYNPARGNGVAQIMDGLQALGPMLGFLALFGPFVLAALPWTIDHETKHVYPLSLPISWSHWVSMRFAAGAITLILPALALYLGSLAVLGMIELPPLLRGYAGALAFRFFLATLVAYSATFALQYLAGRRAAIVALLGLIGILLSLFIIEVLGFGDAGRRLGTFLFEWPGPFAIFVEPWTLIDV